MPNAAGSEASWSSSSVTTPADRVQRVRQRRRHRSDRCPSPPGRSSMQKHLAIIGERAAAAYDETLDGTLAVQIFGPVDPQMLSTIRAPTGEGVSLTVATEHLGGFTRSG